MSPWDEPIDPADDDQEYEAPRYRPEADGLTQALGATWYATRYEVEECRQTFPNSVIVGTPERFDRCYVQTSVGPVLVDLLVGDGDQIDAQARRKHVAFKRRWCAENGRRYLVLSEQDVEDPARIVELLADAPAAELETPAPKRQRPAKRGAIQRPKAAV